MNPCLRRGVQDLVFFYKPLEYASLCEGDDGEWIYLDAPIRDSCETLAASPGDCRRHRMTDGCIS